LATSRPQRGEPDERPFVAQREADHDDVAAHVDRQVREQFAQGRVDFGSAARSVEPVVDQFVDLGEVVERGVHVGVGGPLGDAGLGGGDREGLPFPAPSNRSSSRSAGRRNQHRPYRGTAGRQRPQSVDDVRGAARRWYLTVKEKAVQSIRTPPLCSTG
jgi:hypothetical protein